MSGPAPLPGRGDDILLDDGVLLPGPVLEFNGDTAVRRQGGHAVLPWRTAWRTSKAFGIAVSPEAPEQPWAQIAVRLTKGKAGVLSDLAAATRLLTPGGRLVVVGPTSLGIGGWSNRLAAVWGEPTVGAHRARGRALIWTGPCATVQAPAPGQVPLLPADLDPDAPLLTVLPGVFSGDGLDEGTATLLRFLKDQPRPARIADIGCGAGHLGLAAIRQWGCQGWLVDADYRAVQSANLNAATLGVNAEIMWGDGSDVWPEGCDLMLSNPPAHVGQDLDLGPGLALIERGFRTLAPGGRLLAVANRQLPYERPLQRLGRLTMHDRGPFKVLELTRD